MDKKTQVQSIEVLLYQSSGNLGDDAELSVVSSPTFPNECGTFDGYRIVQLLGRGGMGSVYRAVDPVLGRSVALKFMLPELAASLIGRTRFLREAKAVAAIRNDHIVTIYQIGEEGQIPYIAMEYLEGVSLAKRLELGPLPLVEIIRIGREVATGLAAAHAAGVVHRDIKPANIWLETGTDPSDPDATKPGLDSNPSLAPPESSFRVKLLDFGLARLAESEEPLSHKGKLVGTPAYMAPEQIQGRGVDHQSDLFALGVVLYQCVTGRLPFDRAAVIRVLSGEKPEPTPITSLAPNVPGQFADLIFRLLAISPQDRPQTAAQVVQELRAIEGRLLLGGGCLVPVPAPAAYPVVWRVVNEASDTAVEATAGRSSRRRARSHGSTWVAAVTVLIASAVVAATVYHLTPAKPVASRAPEPVAPPPASKPVKSREPVPLFNGKNLAGWHPPIGGRVDGWSIANGVLVGTPKPGGSQWLLTDREYEDFDLRVEYRWQKPNGHTSVAFRVQETRKPTEPLLHLQVNLRDEVSLEQSGQPENSLYRTGGLVGVQTSPFRDSKPAGEWNVLRIVVRGQQVTIEHNNKVTFDADLDHYPEKVAKLPALKWSKGAIGLCSHVWAPIEYRSVTILSPK